MKKIKLESPEYVCQATSIDQFRTPSGPRRMSMPYWLTGSVGIHFISPDMDIKKFEVQLENGEVFIQEKYLEVPDSAGTTKTSDTGVKENSNPINK